MIERFHKGLLTFILAAASALSAHAQTEVDYKLGAGDDIKIQVFQNPDLAVETRVPETGVISYPLVGSVKIGGLSVTAAQKAIADALQQGKFVKNPQVTITLGLVRGAQVSVLGQVNRPGRFTLETDSRATDMLAAAGGATPVGDDVAIVIGTRNGKPFRKSIDIASLFLDNRPEDQIPLQGGDAIYVHRAPVFYIYGEAQRPGPYRVERGMTVMEALAQGGGPTPRGSETRLRLSRKDANGAVQDTVPKLTDLIQANDVIYVRESLF